MTFLSPNKYLPATTVCFCLLALSACSNRIQVTEYPEHFDSSLATLNTYCWAEPAQLDDKHMHENPLEKADPTGSHHSAFDGLVKTTIDTQLGKKHYQKIACEKADFHMDYRMNMHEDVVAMDTATDSPELDAANPYGIKWRIGDNGSASYDGLSGPEENIITVRHGTIHVGAFSANHQIIWHSSAEKTLDDRDSEETRKTNLTKAIKKIMKTFPTHETIQK